MVSSYIINRTYFLSQFISKHYHSSISVSVHGPMKGPTFPASILSQL